MKERSREMGSSPPTAEEIFRDYSASRTHAIHSLTNDHHDSPLSPYHCRCDHRGHITAVENTTLPSSCKRLGRENITIPVWFLFKLVHYQRMDHIRERKYNHTCVVTLQIGALSTNGSRQIMSKAGHPAALPLSI